MKYEIMLSILFELLSKRTVKASYLSEKYEVSVRSIYRYIESLEMAGVPIYTVRGNNGGFSIIDTYKLSSTFMTVEEFEHTINALTSFTESVPDKILERALIKLKASIKNEYSGFSLKSGNLIIDAGPWGDAIGYKNKLVIIQKCIEENKVLKITYHDRNGEITEREIEPHLIMFKQGLWYTFAYCNLRKDFRFFKIGRIQSATITDETFIRKDISKMDLPLDFWHNSVKAEKVIMEIDKKYLSDIEEWLGIENIEEENGKFIAKATLPFDFGLVSKIMSYGAGIKVIEPKELKEQIKKTVQEIIKNYE